MIERQIQGYLRPVLQNKVPVVDRVFVAVLFAFAGIGDAVDSRQALDLDRGDAGILDPRMELEVEKPVPELRDELLPVAPALQRAQFSPILLSAVGCLIRSIEVGDQ